MGPSAAWMKSSYARGRGGEIICTYMWDAARTFHMTESRTVQARYASATYSRGLPSRNPHVDPNIDLARPGPARPADARPHRAVRFLLRRDRRQSVLRAADHRTHRARSAHGGRHREPDRVADADRLCARALFYRAARRSGRKPQAHDRDRAGFDRESRGGHVHAHARLVPRDFAADRLFLGGGADSDSARGAPRAGRIARQSGRHHHERAVARDLAVAADIEPRRGSLRLARDVREPPPCS